MVLTDSPTSPTETEAGAIEDARARQRWHRRAAAVIIAVLVTVGLAVGVAGGGGGSGRDANGGVLGPKEAAAIFDSHKVPDALLRRYRILITHHVSAATLPADSAVRAIFGLIGSRHGEPSPARSDGLDTSDIAEVQPAPGIHIWLIPGVSGLCGVEREKGGGFGGCGNAIETLGPGSTGNYPRGAEAAGFATNEVKAVILHLSDGSTLRVPVKDNTYFKRLHGHLSITGITPAQSKGP